MCRAKYLTLTDNLAWLKRAHRAESCLWLRQLKINSPWRDGRVDKEVVHSA